MGHGVFLCHSAKDAASTDIVCRTLEEHGIGCWVAPRNIQPGAEWAGAIKSAIRNSPVLVLVYTRHANDSKHVLRELELAARHEVPILPLRLEDVEAGDSVDYYIGTSHWLDASTLPLAPHLEKLVEAVASLLPAGATASGGDLGPKSIAGTEESAMNEVGGGFVPKEPEDRPASAARARPAGLRKPIAILVAVLLIAGGGLLWRELSNTAEKAAATRRESRDSMEWATAGAKRIREPRTGIEFVLVESGRFQMGSNHGDSDEQPVHPVTIGQPFYLAKTEVTQNQWEALMGNNPSHFKGPNHPVQQVSWDDCQEFLKKLNEKKPKGWRFTLPSEAQWEYACRAGTKGKYSLGDDEKQLGQYAWCAVNADLGTHDVATRSANPWGLCDRHGNVWEWCEDTYQKSYDRAPRDGSAWVVRGTGDRVIRGGSWDDTAGSCRSANRNGGLASNGSYYAGFRPAIVVTTK